MFKKYLVEVYYIDDLIFRKRFKSLNNAVKVCAGFDQGLCIEITNLITDKIYNSPEVKDMVFEFINELEEE